jgi:hypothetical protein
MTPDRVDSLRETTPIARVDRRHPDEHRQRKNEKDEHRKHQDSDESQSGVEDLIDHRLELLAEDDEPVVLDEDLPENEQHHDLDLLL